MTSESSFSPWVVVLKLTHHVLVAVWGGAFSPPVMVNFRCHFDWAKRCPVEHYFWVCLEGCFWKGLAFELVDGVKKTVLIHVGGRHPIH